MTTISQDIRGALQERAATAAGFPAANLRHYEGVPFTVPAATPGVCYARLNLLPQTIRPYDVSNRSKRHIGIFQVSLFYASTGSPGTGPVEIIADAVRDVFAPGLVLTKNGERIKVDWSQRADANSGEPEWIACPVTVSWHCFSRRA